MCYLGNLERITSKDGFPFYPSSHLSAALVLEDRPTIVTNHPCKKTETGECRKFNLSICHLESNERNNIGQPGSFIVPVETNRSQGTRKQGGVGKSAITTKGRFLDALYNYISILVWHFLVWYLFLLVCSARFANPIVLCPQPTIFVLLQMPHIVNMCTAPFTRLLQYHVIFWNDIMK